MLIQAGRIYMEAYPIGTPPHGSFIWRACINADRIMMMGI